jgi:predicted transcriptional regulator
MAGFLQTILFYFSWIIGAAGAAGFVLLVYLYRRNEQKERERLKQTKADIADIMILFQTMRDVTKQQKSLAREFNEELDRKMGVVKEVLTRGLDKNKQLYERQQSLVREMDQMRSELQRLHNQVKQLRDEARDATRPPAGPRAYDSFETEEITHAPGNWKIEKPRTGHDDDSPHAFVSLPEEPDQVPAPEDTRLRGTGLTGAPFEEWSGLDFENAMESTEQPQENPEDALYGEVEEPQAPADPEQARNAFRDLLDLSDQHGPAEAAGANGQDAEAAPTADGGASSPIQKRVLEYARAGMTVAQIAKELGIGKGEVRLMMSLAQPKRG